MIDFVIVGAARSGTTSLHRYLGQHPDIFMPEAKEISFFLDDHETTADSSAFMKSAYERVRNEKRVGLSQVNMLFVEGVPERIHHYNAEMKILAVLRNPIERAYSAFWFAKTSGWESSDRFEDALARERTGGLATFYDRANFTYLEHGHYADQLARYLTKFGSGQVRAILTDDLIGHPRSTLEKILEWLEVEPDLGTIDFSKRYKVTSVPRFSVIDRAFKAVSSSVFKRFYRRAIPGPVRRWVKSTISTKVLAASRVPFEPPAMDPTTRQMLRDYFEPHNRRLSEILGRDLSSWT